MTVTPTATENPYVGPRPFERGETLFGRETETDALLTLLVAERVVVLHSPSGAGKTSLIQAALIPQLREEGFQVLPPARVLPREQNGELDGADDLNRYVLGVVQSLEGAAGRPGGAPATALARAGLAAYLDGRPPRADEVPPDARASLPGGPYSQMLILDQLEEIVTNDPTDTAAKQEFFTQLGAALRNRRRWALLALREEHLPALTPYARPVPNRLQVTFRLDLLGMAAADEAIREPAAAAGRPFVDAAAIRLVDDLRLTRVQRPDGSFDTQLGPYVEPVQLQVVCRRLWDRLGPDVSRIEPEHLGSVGDVDTALGDYYAQAVQDSAARVGVQERVIRDWFEERLITEQRSRGQVLRGPGQSAGLDNRAIDALIEARLVRLEPRRGADWWYELTHDRLIAPIQANNAAWRQANLNALQRQAALWARRGRGDDYLLAGTALAEAEAWASGGDADLTLTEREFLAACRQRRSAADDVVAQAAERAFGRLSPEEQAPARDILLVLAGGSGTAPPADGEALPWAALQPVDTDLASASALLQRLVQVGLLTLGPSPTGGGELVRLADPAVVRRWQRLRGWLDERRALLHVRGVLYRLPPAERAAHWLRLAAWFAERAPGLAPAAAQHAAALERTLESDFAALPLAAQATEEGALRALNELCEEALELGFDQLVLGREPEAYDARCPFQGLKPFRAEDRAFFFGREALAAELADRLAQHPVLAVVGHSGSGKSSLVLAGLLPLLQAREPDLRWATMTLGAAPASALESLRPALGAAGELLVVDQFEELFTLAGAAERDAFLAALGALAGPHRLVLTMGDDFVADAEAHPWLRELLAAHVVFVGPLTEPELHAAVERQAAEVGLRFDELLLNTLLDDVRGEPGAMPLLQLALRQLWERRHGRWLRLAEYRKLGTVQGAIARAAEDLYAALLPPDQARMRAICLRLTRLGDDPEPGDRRRDTRQRVSFDELVPDGETPAANRALVQQLTEASLVVTSRDAAGQEQVEVAHEAVLRYWPRLRGWLEADWPSLRARQSLRRAAREWDAAGRPEALLLHRGARVEEAQALSEAGGYPLNDLERAYVNACAALRAREEAEAEAWFQHELNVAFVRIEPGSRSSMSEWRVIEKREA